jgi:U3 small nucleolar RNA-associated protein 5
MSRKTTASATSKVSAPPASSTSAAASTATSTPKSSLLKSSFAPSRFQLRLFASVIQSFDSEHLRIHDTNNSRIRCVHKAKPHAKINCLEWGRYPQSKSKSSSQKSSQGSRPPASGEVVVAYGTSDAEICLFSPPENKVVATLVGAHERGVCDVKFSEHSPEELWSIGEDSTLVQWNLLSGVPTKYELGSLFCIQPSANNDPEPFPFQMLPFEL